MKVHQFVRVILDAGGEEIKIRSGTDHRRFRLPSGITFDVPVGGKHNGHVRPWLRAKLRKMLRVAL